jgi:hypothetical protein
MATAGYSGKPLASKLGLKAGQRVLVVDPPANLDALLADAPDGLARLARLSTFDVGWIFVTRKADLARHLARVLPHLADGGMIWVSWPKRASGVAADMTEGEVRAQALPLGLVDIKVCAVDETWSGLKLTRRRSSR